MLKKSIMHYYSLIGLLLSIHLGMLITPIHAVSLFRGPTPNPMRIHSSAMPGETVLKKRLEYVDLIPLSNTYKLAGILQNNFIWNANALGQFNDAMLIGEIVLPLFPWVNFFTSYKRSDCLGFLRKESYDPAIKPVKIDTDSPLIVNNINLIVGDLARFPVYAQVGLMQLPFGLHARKVFSQRLTYINRLFKERLILGGGIGLSIQNASGMLVIEPNNNSNSWELPLYGFTGQYRGHYKMLAFNIGGAFYFGNGHINSSKVPNLLSNARNLYLNIVQGTSEFFIEYGQHKGKQGENYADDDMLYLQHKINFEKHSQKVAFYYGLEKGSILKKAITQCFVSTTIEYNQFLNGLAGVKYDFHRSTTPVLDLERFEFMLQLQLFL